MIDHKGEKVFYWWGLFDVRHPCHSEWTQGVVQALPAGNLKTKVI